MSRPADALAALAVAACLGGGWNATAAAAAPGATAASPAVTVDDTGWWSRADVLDPVVASDVGEGQLLVEGAPDQARAVAAFRATLPAGADDPVLTIRPSASQGLDGAHFLACPAETPWTGASGGEWEARPQADCERSVAGSVDADAGVVTFALGSLQLADQLDVVFTAGAVEGSPPGLDGSVFRVVFDAPSGNDLEVRRAPFILPTTSTTSPPPAVSPGPPAAALPQVPSISNGSFAMPTQPPPSPPTTRPAPVVAAPAAPGQAAAPLVNVARQVPPVASPTDSNGGGRLLGFALVLGAGAALAWSSRLPLPERRVLSRFAMAGPVGAPSGEAPGPSGPRSSGPAPSSAGPSTSAPAATVGGLGRFRRERDTPARRLGT